MLTYTPVHTAQRGTCFLLKSLPRATSQDPHQNLEGIVGIISIQIICLAMYIIRIHACRQTDKQMQRLRDTQTRTFDIVVPDGGIPNGSSNTELPAGHCYSCCHRDNLQVQQKCVFFCSLVMLTEVDVDLRREEGGREESGGREEGGRH